jgi:hypothetical protein
MQAARCSAVISRASRVTMVVETMCSNILMFFPLQLLFGWAASSRQSSRQYRPPHAFRDARRKSVRLRDKTSGIAAHRAASVRADSPPPRAYIANAAASCYEWVMIAFSPAANWWWPV